MYLVRINYRRTGSPSILLLVTRINITNGLFSVYKQNISKMLEPKVKMSCNEPELFGLLRLLVGSLLLVAQVSPMLPHPHVQFRQLTLHIYLPKTNISTVTYQFK